MTYNVALSDAYQPTFGSHPEAVSRRISSFKNKEK
jgi:hypothetical protein